MASEKHAGKNPPSKTLMSFGFDVISSTSSTPTTEAASTCESEDCDRHLGTEHGIVKDFQERWLLEFPWLARTDSGKMICQICQSQKVKTVFGTTGSENYQRSALVRHKSKEHRAARDGVTQQPTITQHVSAVADESPTTSTALGTMLDTAEFFVVHELPEHKFSTVLDHMAKHGCEALKRSGAYQNRRGYEEMEQALADAAEQEISELTAKISFLGLMVDESVDISVHKNLIIYMKLLVNGEPKIVFGDNISVHDGKAETILNAVVKFMDDRGICFSKLVGFSSDGANVMLGRISGVATRLKHVNPNVIIIHCAAHRLALAAFHGAKSCEQLIDLQRTVTQIYTHFEYSAVRYERLRELQMVLGCHVKKFKKPSSVRWLSLQDAIEAVCHSWPVLVAVLEDEWETHRVPEARALAVKVNSYSFLAKTCLVLDVLEPLGKLSKVFQKDTLDIDVMNTMLTTTVTCLNVMKDVQGQHLQDANDQLQTFNPSPAAQKAIKNLKRKYVTAVVTEIDKRLPQNSVCMVNDLNEILNPSKLPLTAHAMRCHGTEQLQRIVDVYGQTLKVKRGDQESEFQPVVNADRAKHDFYQFKCFLNGERAKSLASVCQLLVKDEMKAVYPDFSVLAQICLTLPLTSVLCEQGFSQQNQIKNRLRNRLTVRKLARKMKIKAAAVDLKLPNKCFIETAAAIFTKGRKRVKLA